MIELEEIKKGILELCKKHNCCFHIVHIGDRETPVINVMNLDCKSFDFIFAKEGKMVPLNSDSKQVSMF